MLAASAIAVLVFGMSSNPVDVSPPAAFFAKWKRRGRELPLRERPVKRCGNITVPHFESCGEGAFRHLVSTALPYR